MSKKLQLHIAEPCHENWDNMTPAEKGRFCDACQKQVVDFSTLSDREIVQFFKKPSTGSVCGRFMNDQLDRDMVVEKKRLPWIKYFFQFALPAFLLGKETQAQSGNDQRPTTVQTSQIRGMMGMVRLPTPVKKTLSVLVKDAVTGKPVPYASVFVGGNKKKKVATENGIVSINVDGTKTNLLITVSCVGYKTKSVGDVLSGALLDEGLEVELEVDAVKMEEVVVIAKVERTNKERPPAFFVGLVSCCPYPSKTEPAVPAFKPFIPPAGKIPCLEDIINDKTIVNDSVKTKEVIISAVKSPGKESISIATSIYPNPIIRGGSITVDIKAKRAETIMVKLAATDGKTLIIHKRSISKGNNRFTINTDPAWTSGVYFLVFSNEKGILIKTEELLIQ